MTKIHRFIFVLSMCIAVALGLGSCIEDGFTSSPSDRPVFSTDTLKMGTVFTEQMTTTHRFTVRNPHGKGLIISHIEVEGEGAKLFRLNVDGLSGATFDNVEIRANDSIYVFVEATLPANASDLPVNIASRIAFTTNGSTDYVTVTADGQDVERLRALTLTSDTRFSATKPYQVFDSLVVAEGATLTLPAGARLYFHDGASMIVRGKLLSQGTVEQPVTLSGDRTGNVITDVTFDLMSRQWEGLAFAISSQGNRLSHTNIINTWWGVTVAGDGSEQTEPKLWLQNCRLRNSGDRVLEAYDADVAAYGCEFAEAANGTVYLAGGKHVFNHCTLANYYLFSALGGPLLQLSHLSAAVDPLDTGTPYTRAEFSNCILYGNGTDISHGELTGTRIFLRNCLLKSKGSDDDNFLNCLWDKDPLYYTVREDYLFDYRLKPESPAIGTADPSLTAPDAAVDGYGKARGTTPDIGAYVFQNPE